MLLVPTSNRDTKDGGLAGCSMETVSLDNDPPSYRAISYTWGDAANTRRLEVDGKTIKVPANTLAAVRAVWQYARGAHAGDMPKSEAPIRIWIDAVCINQDDPLERAQQVAIMREIYSQASEVCICLGDSTTNEDDPSPMQGVHAIFENSMRGFNDFRIPPPVHYEESGFFEDRDSEAISRIFMSSWFERMWTVQETAAAYTPVCLFAGAALPLYEVLCVAHILSTSRFSDTQSHLCDAFEGIQQAASRRRFVPFRYRGRRRENRKRMGIWEIRHHKNEDTLFQVLRKVSTYVVTDPRDRVYSMLGYVDISRSKALRVDYTITLAETYARATVHCLQEGRSMEVLQVAAASKRVSLFAHSPPTLCYVVDRS